MVDEILLKIGSELIWLLVTIGSKNKEILGMSISKERNMTVIEHILYNQSEEYDKQLASTDGCYRVSSNLRVFNLKHHIHPSYKKSIIEKTMQYIKDRTRNILLIIFSAERRIVN
jgi:putative transposase